MRPSHGLSVGQSVGHAFTLNMRTAFNVPARVALRTRWLELPSLRDGPICPPDATARVVLQMRRPESPPSRLIASKNVQWMPSTVCSMKEQQNWGNPYILYLSFDYKNITYDNKRTFFSSNILIALVITFNQTPITTPKLSIF